MLDVRKKMHREMRLERVRDKIAAIIDPSAFGRLTSTMGEKGPARKKAEEIMRVLQNEARVQRGLDSVS
jgi:hypothetical protein